MFLELRGRDEKRQKGSRKDFFTRFFCFWRVGGELSEEVQKKPRQPIKTVLSQTAMSDKCPHEIFVLLLNVNTSLSYLMCVSHRPTSRPDIKKIVKGFARTEANWFLRLNYIKALTQPLNLLFLHHSCFTSDCRKKLVFDVFPSAWNILDFSLWLLLFCLPTSNLSYNSAFYGCYYKIN